MMATTALTEWELREVMDEVAIHVRRLHVSLGKMLEEALLAFEALPVVEEGAVT
jgi:hypothetical protein